MDCRSKKALEIFRGYIELSKEYGAPFEKAIAIVTPGPKDTAKAYTKEIGVLVYHAYNRVPPAEPAMPSPAPQTPPPVYAPFMPSMTPPVNPFVVSRAGFDALQSELRLRTRQLAATPREAWADFVGPYSAAIGSNVRAVEGVSFVLLATRTLTGYDPNGRLCVYKRHCVVNSGGVNNTIGKHDKRIVRDTIGRELDEYLVSANMPEALGMGEEVRVTAVLCHEGTLVRYFLHQQGARDLKEHAWHGVVRNGVLAPLLPDEFNALDAATGLILGQSR